MEGNVAQRGRLVEVLRLLDHLGGGIRGAATAKGQGTASV